MYTTGFHGYVGYTMYLSPTTYNDIPEIYILKGKLHLLSLQSIFEHKTEFLWNHCSDVTDIKNKTLFSNICVYGSS